jgi:hypothetical protein
VGFFLQLLTALQANSKMCAEFQNPFSIGTTMSAHNLLQEQLLSDHTLIDAGDGKTISVDRSPAFLDVTTAGAETRVLGAAPRAGLLSTSMVATYPLRKQEAGHLTRLEILLLPWQMPGTSFNSSASR